MRTEAPVTQVLSVGQLAEAVSRAALEGRVPMATAPPIQIKQRGRTGTVAAFNPSKHPRGAHGQFAASGQAQGPSTAKLKQMGAAETARQQGVERSQKAEAKAKAKAERAAERKAEGKSPTSTRSTSRKEKASTRETKERASEAAKERAERLAEGTAWQGKLSLTEPLRPGTGLAKNERANGKVALLQAKLGALGYGVGTTDGKFGPETALAVKQLQREYGLHPTGIIGPRTQLLLESLTERSLQWQKQGIIEARMRPDESVAAFTRAVLSAACSCK